MAHIHTEEGQHDLTTSAFIVLLNDSEPKLWLHRHKIVNKWLQFGGHVELRENPWQALAHEILEESGYALQQLQLLQPSLRLRHTTDAIIHPQPLFVMTHEFPGIPHYHIDLGYAFVTNEMPRNEIGAGEAKALKAMTLQEISDFPKSDVPENIRESALFLLTEVLAAWERVDPGEFTL